MKFPNYRLGGIKARVTMASPAVSVSSRKTQCLNCGLRLPLSEHNTSHIVYDTYCQKCRKKTTWAAVVPVNAELTNRRLRVTAKPKIQKAEYVRSEGDGAGFHEVYKEADGQEFEVYPPARDEMDGTRLPWRVTFEGAVDFEGNKAEMLRRYPELRGVRL